MFTGQEQPKQTEENIMESIFTNAFRARIAVLLDNELCEAGAKESRKEEIHTMLNNGRWDCLRMISTDEMVMQMISADLMQQAHEEWLSSPDLADVE